ncbi:hypothetical protein N7454_004285 [Penicillium verhagenii]|nr:hypothetical protein N7454_004285 [Penicillium verhagenii]
MPSPYRKSCRDCVKAKRRCDLHSPCYRCRVRSLPCTYEKPLHTRPRAVAEIANGEDLMTPVSPQSVTSVNATEIPDANTSIGPLDVYDNAPAGQALTGSAFPPFPDFDLDWQDIMKDIDSFAVPDQVGMDNTSPTRSVLVASVQALCIYQIVQLFDGDIALRSQAEEAGPILDRWLRQLKCQANPVSDSLNHTTNPGSAHDAWRAWVFDECVRRTLIVGFSIEGLYSFLKHGWDASHHDFVDLCFYAQRALWTAPSEYFWLAALQDHLLLPVWFRSWEHDIDQAQPGDMEELGMIMMGFIKGIDYCRHWLGKDALHTFGLALNELGSTA